MNSATDQQPSNPATPAPTQPVHGSFNVVGNNNTVVFPGPGEEWSETRAFILRALPQLSEAELAEIQALVQRAFQAGQAGG